MSHLMIWVRSEIWPRNGGHWAIRASYPAFVSFPSVGHTNATSGLHLVVNPLYFQSWQCLLVVDFDDGMPTPSSVFDWIRWYEIVLMKLYLKWKGIKYKFKTLYFQLQIRCPLHLSQDNKGTDLVWPLNWLSVMCTVIFKNGELCIKAIVIFMQLLQSLQRSLFLCVFDYRCDAKYT